MPQTNKLNEIKELLENSNDQDIINFSDLLINKFANSNLLNHELTKDNFILFLIKNYISNSHKIVTTASIGEGCCKTEIYNNHDVIEPIKLKNEPVERLFLGVNMHFPCQGGQYFHRD